MFDRRQPRIERLCLVARIIVRLHDDGGIRTCRENGDALQGTATRDELGRLAEQRAAAGARAPGLAGEDQRLIGGDYFQVSVFTAEPRASCAGGAESAP